jgi:hypothetical protein
MRQKGILHYGECGVNREVNLNLGPFSLCFEKSGPEKGTSSDLSYWPHIHQLECRIPLYLMAPSYSSHFASTHHNTLNDFLIIYIQVIHS